MLFVFPNPTSGPNPIVYIVVFAHTVSGNTLAKSHGCAMRGRKLKSKIIYESYEFIVSPGKLICLVL